MKTFTFNPYTWDESANEVTSGVVDFDIRGVNVSGLSTPVSITVPSGNKPNIPTDVNYTHYFMKPETVNVHVVSIEKLPTSLFLTVAPDNNSVSFELLVGFGKRPKADQYDRRFHLPDISTCSLSGSSELRTNLSNCTSNPFTVFLGEGIINSTGLYYFGVLISQKEAKEERRSRRSCFGKRRQKRACVEDKDPPPTPATAVNKSIIPQYDPRTDVNYTVKIAKQNCLYWSDSKQKWTSDGCKVRNAFQFRISTFKF